MRGLFSRPDVRLLILGQIPSMFGDLAMYIALAIWAKVLTGSASAAGLIFFVLALASLAAPLGGLVVDRAPKRPLMIGTHLALAAIVSLLLFVHDRGDLWILYLVAGLYGLGGDIFGAARAAMLKAMLPDELIGDANGAYQSLREGLRIVAPLAGAGIFAVAGGAAVALVDAGTFLVSAATLVALRFTEPPPAPREHHFLREMSAGLTHIARTQVLRQFTIGLGAVLLVAGFGETLIFAITSDSLHRSPAFVGVLDTFQGVGSIAGGVTAAAVMRRVGDLRIAGYGIVLFALGIVLWLVPILPLVLAGSAIAGAGIVWAVVALSTAYQRYSPAHMQGRVAAAANMLFSVPQTISIAAGAVLITLIDWRIEIVAVTIVFALASVYMLTRQPVQEPEAEAIAA